MGLNHLYFEHQISLMRAADALSDPARRKHLCAAGVISGQIFDLLSLKNAPASAGWLPQTDQFRSVAQLAIPA